MDYKVKGTIKHKGFAKRTHAENVVSFSVDTVNIDNAIEWAKAQLAKRYQHSQYWGGWLSVYRVDNSGKFLEEKRVAVGKGCI